MLRAWLFASMCVACGGRLDDSAVPDAGASPDVAVTPDASAGTTKCVAAMHTILASGQSPYVITIDDGYVYWVNRAPLALRRVPKGGGPVEDLATLPMIASEILVDGSFVYANAGAVWRAPKAGGTATQLSPDTGFDAQSLAIDSTTLYWADDDSLHARVHAMPIGGGPSALLGSVGGMWIHVAADGDGYVYLAHSSGVSRIDASGALTQLTVQDQSGPTVVIALDATNVYFVTQVPQTIWTMPKSGGQATYLASAAAARQLVVDDTYVYWADAGHVWHVDKTGGWPSGIASYAQSANAIAPSIAIEPNCVYWASVDDGTINVAPK